MYLEEIVIILKLWKLSKILRYKIITSTGILILRYRIVLLPVDVSLMIHEMNAFKDGIARTFSRCKTCESFISLGQPGHRYFPNWQKRDALLWRVRENTQWRIFWRELNHSLTGGLYRSNINGERPSYSFLSKYT